MNVLIIDDSGVMRRIHKNTLLEHEVPESGLFEAANGIEALRVAIDNKIDIFLVDWNTPELDGLELVKQLRILKTYAETPATMITSGAAKYNVMEAIKAGVSDYVVKPIRGDVMWGKIKKYVKG